MKKKKEHVRQSEEDFIDRVDPQIMEHFDAYVLVGYTADKHQKVIRRNFGSDPSCKDGLQVVQMLAGRWLNGTMVPDRPAGGEGWKEGLS